MKDIAYYDESGGGMTISGGEPLLFPEFTSALAEKGKKSGLNICLDTCGHVPFDYFQILLPYTDIFLYDLKETDPARHEQYTGVSNEVIVSNLLMLDNAGAKIILRCPIIPGINDRIDHFMGIAATANKLNNLMYIDIEPYHPLGKSKNERLGREYPLSDLGFVDEKTVCDWMKSVQGMTNWQVRRA